MLNCYKTSRKVLQFYSEACITYFANLPPIEALVNAALASVMVRKSELLIPKANLHILCRAK